MKGPRVHVEGGEWKSRDTLPFPRVAQWEAAARRAQCREEVPRPEAIRAVESAMRDAQQKFDRLRAMLGFPAGGDGAPPRAA